MGDAHPVSFGGAKCSKDFRVRTLNLQPRTAIDYRQADWVDTLVVVERGELEIECCSGARALFREGAVLVFTGLGLRCLRNSSRTTLVLSAVSRTRSAD